ncbi:MAG: hypothetical protein EXS39_07720 [Opitutaceae bacterium]|nr:hypothetical protein [Opitutaceae bacterium]
MNRVVAAIRPRPEFIAFLGDAVKGYTDAATLRHQWDYWWNTEMRWIQGTGVPLYQSTSNHNTYDFASEDVFREVHAQLPNNGPADQQRLAYFVRRGDLLYVSTHQPDRTRPYRRDMLIDTQWLDSVLRENADARSKFVVGHYPVFPVNGYTQYPLWCFRPEEREPFWDVLVRHRVTAYLASHILAFDVQVHSGIPQIVSGGAGTQGSGSRALQLMPSRSEYLHAVQVAVDERELRYRVLDPEGKVRESLRWPFRLKPADSWSRIEPGTVAATMKSAERSDIIAWRIRGQLAQIVPGDPPQTLVAGWEGMEGCATVWIGIEGPPATWVVRLVPQSGYGWQTWTGPMLKEGAAFDRQIALHRDMGPGGILWRHDDTAAWTSLSSTSSKGAEDLTWPPQWAIGHAQSGPVDWRFRGNGLDVSWTAESLPGSAVNPRNPGHL